MNVMDATQLDLRIVSILLKFWCINLSAYPNVYSSKGIFLFKVMSTIQFNPKPNKRDIAFLEQTF